MKEKKDNTSLIVIVCVIVLFVVGLLAFMMSNNNKLEKNVTNDVPVENQQTDVEINGYYSGKYTEKTVVDKAEDVVDNAKEKAEEITGNDTDNEKADNETEYTLELSLETDGTGQFVNTKTGDEVLSGTYSQNNNIITFTVDDSMDKFEFTINDDNSLTYAIDDNSVSLVKTEKSELKYIS